MPPEWSGNFNNYENNFNNYDDNFNNYQAISIIVRDEAE